MRPPSECPLELQLMAEVLKDITLANFAPLSQYFVDKTLISGQDRDVALVMAAFMPALPLRQLSDASHYQILLKELVAVYFNDGFQRTASVTLEEVQVPLETANNLVSVLLFLD